MGPDASGIKACGLLGIAGGDHASGAEQLSDVGKGTVAARRWSSWNPVLVGKSRCRYGRPDWLLSLRDVVG
jgi:hypothetical protein